MGFFSKVFNTLFGNKLKIEINKKDELISYKDSEKIALQNRVDKLEKEIDKNSLAIYEDKEQKKLKSEIINLEDNLENLSEEKNEYINELNSFNTKYTLELGESIEELLEIKQKYLYLQIKQNKNVDNEIYKEYEELQEEHKNFHSQYEETVATEENKGIINSEDLKELKRVFRKAVRICHPDIVSDDKKDEAHNIMYKLNDAYQRKMLDEVVEIFENLNINFDSHQLVFDRDSLKKQIAKLKKAIDDIKLEIDEILQSEEYILLSDIDDLEEYFENSKKEFKNEIRYTEEELEKLNICDLETDFIKIENSKYSQALNEIQNQTFKKIRQVSIDYIMNIENPDNLHHQLNQGVTVIEKEELLYKYIFSYGKMHKVKLYSSFDKVIHQLNNQSINVIDWGCGQALATSLLIEYIKENKLDIDISNITLIEPSELALSRGLLHIDVLKENEIDVRAINKDIDSLKTDDLIINNSNTTLHLFSNILDVEFFKLDRIFLDKIANSQNGLNYFICVSPNINDKRNTRLDMFYRYFDDNYETELISARDSDIGNYKRYEKVFKATL